MRKKRTSIITITALAVHSDQILADQYEGSATKAELDYIAVDVGAASSL